MRDFDPDAGTLMLPDPKGGRALVVYLEAEGSTLFLRAAAGKLPDRPLPPRFMLVEIRSNARFAPISVIP